MNIIDKIDKYLTEATVTCEECGKKYDDEKYDECPNCEEDDDKDEKDDEEEDN